jgi:hypothetical protein
MKQFVGQACLIPALLFEAPLLARAHQPAPTGGDRRELTSGGPVEMREEARAVRAAPTPRA